MFVTFTKEENHFLDNIQNGFLLNNHSVEFDTLNVEILEIIISFWNEYKITGSLITVLTTLHTNHNGCNKEFIAELQEILDRDTNLRSLYSNTFNSLRAQVKMKCFTEIRDNQKINSRHTGYFGSYGIILSHEWMEQKQAAPVLYVDKKNVMSMLMAKNSTIMNTLDSAVAMLSGTKATISGNNFFDLFSFFEISNHRYEYEWRIVSGHNLYGGSKIFPKRDRINFSQADVKAIYIPNERNIAEFKTVLNTYGWNNFDKIYHVSEIILTDEDHNKLEKIRNLNIPT